MCSLLTLKPKPVYTVTFQSVLAQIHVFKTMCGILPENL